MGGDFFVCMFQREKKEE
jgi:hypothetical protein